MLSFQRVILWPLLALIFFIIYYFDKIYLVKIHFYSRTLSPGSNKSERKQRIQDNFVGDCGTKIQRTRGGLTVATIQTINETLLSSVESLQQKNLTEYQCSDLLHISGCDERFSRLESLSSQESVYLRSHLSLKS